MDNTYDWIQAGKKYRKKPQYQGHMTRKSVEVTKVHEHIDCVEFNYLLGRGSGSWLTFRQFAELYEP